MRSLWNQQAIQTFWTPTTLKKSTLMISLNNAVIRQVDSVKIFQISLFSKLVSSKWTFTSENKHKRRFNLQILKFDEYPANFAAIFESPRNYHPSDGAIHISNNRRLKMCLLSNICRPKVYFYCDSLVYMNRSHPLKGENDPSFAHIKTAA